MFARFVRPLLATIYCVWEIWSGSNNCICVTYFTSWEKLKQQKRVTTPILKLTSDQKLETFFAAKHLTLMSLLIEVL